MARVDRLVVETPAEQGARAVADDEHVGHVEQLVEQLLSLVLAEVEGDAALVAADALPHQADAVLGRPPGPQGVAGAGLLDLDDLGPELAEHGGHHRAGHQGGGVDHPEPGQRARLGQPRAPHSGRASPRLSRRVAPV